MSLDHPTNHIRWIRALATSVGVGLAVAGCSSSPSTSATTTASRASSSTLPATPGDETLAKNELLQLSDLPSGWSASGSITSGAGTGLSPQQIQQLASCLGISVSAIDTNPAQASSPTFNDPTGVVSVQDDVSVYPNAQGARTDFSTFSNPKSPSCIVSVFGPTFRKEAQSGLQSGQTFGTLSASKKTFPSYGDESGQLELVAPITQGNQVVHIYVDIYIVVKGRGESVILVFSPGSPFPLNTATQIVDHSVSHLG